MVSQLRTRSWCVLLTTFALGTAACAQPRAAEPDANLPARAERSAAALTHARIFFAHQSVGENILDGLKGIADDSRRPLPLSVVDLGSEGTRSGVLIHAKLGINGDPAGKTLAFADALASGLGDTVDMAMQKYCFADISSETDAVKLFTQYRNALVGLQLRYPRVRFAHVTAPLTVLQSGPKATVKKLIGRAPDHYADNIARERFNELMRREYGGREPIFDLAVMQSSPYSGPRISVAFANRHVFGLLPEFSSDGAHLNAAMERHAAVALLDFLANLAAPIPAATTAH